MSFPCHGFNPLSTLIIYLFIYYLYIQSDHWVSLIVQRDIGIEKCIEKELKKTKLPLLTPAYIIAYFMNISDRT